MADNIKTCASCKVQNEVNAKYCSSCGGANFEIFQPYVAPAASTPARQSYPSPINDAAPTTRGDVYLSAIALYLRVYWLLLLGFIVGAITAALGFWASASAHYTCDYYSCHQDTGLANAIYIIGGLASLAIYITGIVSGFRATARVREAENI